MRRPAAPPRRRAPSPPRGALRGPGRRRGGAGALVAAVLLELGGGRGAATAGAPAPSTYAQRLRAALVDQDPRVALAGRAQIEEARRLIALGPGACDAGRRRHALKVVASTTHPTGYVIPRLLRPAAFAYTNIPVVLASLLFCNSAAGILIVQVANQSLNACFNMANSARGFADTSKREALTDFATALLLGSGVAIAASWVRSRLPWSGGLTGVLVTYLAVASAGCANMCSSRRAELTDGVVVTDQGGSPIGVSRAAGRASVLRALGTRSLLLPLVALLVPAALTRACAAAWPALAGVGPASLALQTALIALTLLVGLPACVALFPETLRLPLGKLEAPVRERAVAAAAPGPAPEFAYVFRGM